VTVGLLPAAIGISRRHPHGRVEWASEPTGDLQSSSNYIRPAMTFVTYFHRPKRTRVRGERGGGLARSPHLAPVLCSGFWRVRM